MRVLPLFVFLLTIILLSNNVITKGEKKQKGKVADVPEPTPEEPQDNNEPIQKDEPQVSDPIEIVTEDPVVDTEVISDKAEIKQEEKVEPAPEPEKVETVPEPKSEEPQINNDQIPKEETPVSEQKEVTTEDPITNTENTIDKVTYVAPIDFLDVIFMDKAEVLPSCSNKVDLKVVYEKLQEYMQCQ